MPANDWNQNWLKCRMWFLRFKLFVTFGQGSPKVLCKYVPGTHFYSNALTIENSSLWKLVFQVDLVGYVMGNQFQSIVWKFYMYMRSQTNPDYFQDCFAEILKSSLYLFAICFLSEIQNSYRRSPKKKAHGVPRWRCASRHYEGQSRFLDDTRRVPRKGHTCSRKTVGAT